jgi:hypothetical protein
MELPLYRMVVERLGLKGPALAYIISHDSIVFKTLSRTRLETRYELFRRSWKGRRLRSKLLIMLAYEVVLHKHSRYLEVYKEYRQRGKKLADNPTRGEKNSKRHQKTSDGGLGGRTGSSLTEKRPRGPERSRGGSRQ